MQQLKQYKPITWGPIGREVYERTYSRKRSDGSQETWRDTVERVVDGNLAFVESKHHMKREREDLVALMTEFKILPAGRHLWVTGVSGRQFISNCHTAGWSPTLTDHYDFTFDELMKGGGVGANYSSRYVDLYDAPRQAIELHFICSPSHRDYDRFKELLSTKYHHEWRPTGKDAEVLIEVEDSREGWVAALRTLMNAAWDRTPISLLVDVGRIRAYGEPIRSFGGTASGPYPLMLMMRGINSLLNSRIGLKLSGLDHMAIDHMIASCVVAGNVRRSARMSIKNWADHDILDFINCKDDKDRSAHWTTNISVEVDHAFFRAFKRGDKHAVAVYNAAVASMKKNGEPGFWNRSYAQEGEVDDVYCTNPCGEISMKPWENCNLGHLNLDAFYDDPEGAKYAFRLMARFLIRATFADITSPLQRKVVDRNRRIGVGFFGFQGWLCKQGIKYSESHQNERIKRLLRSFYTAIRQEAREYAFQLRIPEPVKVTTVAPTGTIAKMPGKSEGMQAIYGKYFDRRVRYGADSPKIQELKDQGIDIEQDYYDKTGNTLVAIFRCKDILVEEMEELGLDPSIIEDQSEISLEDSLAVQAMVQREFVDNSISFTVNLLPEITESQLSSVLIKYLPELKGTTILVGDGDRPQSPYTRISKEDYNSHSGPTFTGQSETECKNNVCPIK